MFVPGFGALGLDANFAPHWFARGSVLVLSTDPELSKQLVERLAGTTASTLLAERLVDWTYWPGQQWGDTCAAIAHWLRRLPESERNLRGPASLVALFESVAALSRSAEAVETITALDGAVLRAVTSLRMRELK